MSRVFGCLIEQHDLRLVALAVILCLFACTTAMTMVRRARVSRDGVQGAWLVGAGVVAGAGIWGTHFVFMLALRAGFPVAFDLGLTLLSAAIAVTLCISGCAIAVLLRRPALGGAAIGAAIVAMHFVGMGALRVPVTVLWDPIYVAGSVLFGVGAMAATTSMAMRHGSIWSHIAAAALFTVAICGVHFAAMAAATYHFDPTAVASDALLDPEMVAIAVAAVAVLIVTLGLVGALVDSHLATRVEHESRRLQDHIVELESTKAALEDTSKRLGEALEQAALANRSKSAFLAAMSHELRTPLNAVIGFSELMTMEAFGPLGCDRYKQYAGDIHESGTHLLALINDILDLSRLDTGDMTLQDDVVDLNDVVIASTRLMTGQAEKMGLKLSVQVAKDVPLIQGNARRLKQILINLLSNAIKFTSPGGAVALHVACRPHGIALTVQDSGIGMAPGDIPRALERFGQVDSRLSRKYEGVGLGLPIAKQLTEMHGGTLTIESELHVGTTVTVTLPEDRIVILKTHKAA